MIVIGIDSHKDTLAGCLIDQTGRQLEEHTFANTPGGHAQVVSWAQTSDTDRVAIEGSGNYGRPVALALVDAGVETVEVPPQMTARARRGQRTGSTSDQSDALLIARVGAREDDLPTPRPNGVTEDLRCLFRYRTELVKSRNQDINRLHADLEQLRCGYQRKITTPLTTTQALGRVSRLITANQTPRAQIVRNRVRHIRTLNRWIDELTTQIVTVVQASGATLTTIYGIGALTAAEILAEVGDPARFATKAKFAMANGAAPLQASSGRTMRHRLNRGGNRRLNKAIHIAAITQIARAGTEGRTYYQRKLASDKTKREAIRALKRRISDRIWTHLQPPNPTPNLTVRIWGVPFGVLRLAAGGGVVTLNLTDPVWCLSYDLSDIDHQRRPGVPRWPDQKPVHPKRGVTHHSPAVRGSRHRGTTHLFRKTRREMP